MGEFHFYAALIFSGFILTDRLILRPALCAETLKPVYKQAAWILVPVAGVLLLSGLELYGSDQIAKALLGGATLLLFFLCPWAAAHLGSRARALYRTAVLVFLLLTIFWGRL
jgi:hypothetical protein